MELHLFLVVLGGRASKSNIEVHDIRWVVGETINETFPTLREEWFGEQKGLHIDSYKAIKYIDGYKIKITEANKTYPEDIVFSNKSLWFINLGGYKPEKIFYSWGF